MSGALALVRGVGHMVKAGGVAREQEAPCRTLQLDLPAERAADIQFSDITLTVKSGWGKGATEKTILKSISGSFKSGQLTAIMGPSGAGKSSLLNALTGFSTDGVTGTITIGGMKTKIGSRRNLKSYRKQSCYILQDDRLNPLFTVQEILDMAAHLKLGNSLTEKAKTIVTKDVLNALGLSGTERTRCGHLSGGQRKRLSVALELIDNPPVMFLDEPTTGLDSSSSTHCIEVLKKLAQGGRTIVCTVHQPTASVYRMFDLVYVLADGLCIYQGSSENTVPYLASVGLHCPKYHNPADYLLEVANGEYGQFNDQLALANKAQDWRKKSEPTSSAEKNKNTKTTVLIAPPTEFYKLFVLIRRSALQLYRDWTVTHLRVLLHTCIGVLLGLLFQDSGFDGSKTVANAGYLIISIIYLIYTSLMPAVVKFPQELPILKKENFNNWYKLKTYYLAVLITNIPLQILFSLVYCSSSYFLSGQPLELYRFLMFAAVMALITLISDAMGNLIGTCVNAVNGTFLGAIYTAMLLLFAGYLVFFSHMSYVMRLVSYGAYTRYAMEAIVLSVYGYGRAPLVCPEGAEYCHNRYPDKFIEMLDMGQDNYWMDVCVLCVKLILLRTLAYFTLNRKMKISKA